MTFKRGFLPEKDPQRCSLTSKCPYRIHVGAKSRFKSDGTIIYNPQREYYRGRGLQYSTRYFTVKLFLKIKMTQTKTIQVQHFDFVFSQKYLNKIYSYF